MRIGSDCTVPIRGIDYHVRQWGPRDAPKLFMLHGWMDVGASFQFLVDALERDWHVLAPDWRGFGKSGWSAQGYWFYDYLADLDQLLAHFSPGEPTRLVGHSLGGNVVMLYAGVRPERVARVVSLDAFGLPAEGPERAPGKIERWLGALADPPAFKPYDGLEAVADRLQRNNPRLTRERAVFLAGHWAERLPDGRARLVSDPKHKLPFPTVYRLAETLAVWEKIRAPVLCVGASESTITKWLGEDDNGIDARLSHVPDCRRATIADAGHMLHHDRPEAVAAAIEPFLAGADVPRDDARLPESVNAASAR